MLSDLLFKLFVKDHQRVDAPQVRLAYGELGGYVGLVVNLVLFGVKLTLGVISGSIAIITDAVNNLADLCSSLITIFGFKFSAYPADEHHPFGHGRLEYVAGVIVAVIIIAIGFNFFKDATGRIFSPVPVKSTPGLLIIMGVTVLVKLWLYCFYREIGVKIKSSVITASAWDSLSDSGATLLVIFAVFTARYTAWPIDGAVGLALSVVLIYGGVKVLRDTINPLLGECPPPKLVAELRKCLLNCPGICGVHDVIIHNYGPQMYFATAHAEVDGQSDILEVHDLLERAELEVFRHMPVRLVLHCDPFATTDEEVNQWRRKLQRIVTALDIKLRVHDFRIVKKDHHLQLIFQLLMPRVYSLSEAEIAEILQSKMQVFDADLELKIIFVHTYF